MAMAQGKIYTFGPTFRAEKSVTRRHLSEFWMIEPEMAVYDLEMDMQLIERFLRSVVNEVIAACPVELATLERNLDNLLKVNQPFPRISYSDAVPVLRGEKDINGKNSLRMLENDIEEANKNILAKKTEIEEREKIINNPAEKKGVKSFNATKVLQLQGEIKDLEEKLRNIPKWLESAKNFEFGNDLGGSDETILTRLFDSPVMVYNWPTKIKAFYMKEVEGNPEFVKGVDVLAPEGYGEIVGGSERETDLDLLIRKIHEHDLPMEAFEWYLDLRRFGNEPHAGFGLGLERMVCWISGISEIRESIPFMRRYGTLFP
jgi:asparaginyl-tRNA synthetase